MQIFGYEIKKATKQKVPEVPMGFVGLKTASGKVEEEFLDALQWPDAGKVYQEMMSNDAVVGGCLYLIETIIRQARWGVEAASEDAGDREAAEFLESCMNDMVEQPWDDFITEVLSMLPYGFSFHEIVYKTRRGPLEKDLKFKSNYTDGRIGWQCLPGRSQATLSEWEFDDRGNAITFIQDPSLVGGMGEIKNIPLQGNLLFRTKVTRGNPEGWSILRRAYRSWYFKRYIEELEGIGIERNLAGIPVLAPPPDVPLFDPHNKEMVEMLNWAQQLVDELRQDKNHGVIIPSTDWKLTLLGTEGSSKSMDTDTIIRRHENRIAMSMLSDVVLMGGDRTGSFALAETKQGLLMRSLQAIINSICSVLNTYAVPALFAANNWTLEKLPKIKADDLEPVTIKDVALMLRSFSRIDITKDQKLFNFLLNLIQAPELSDEEYAAFIAAQAANTDTGFGGDGNGDTIDNDFKQQGDQYTGMEDT